MHVVKGILKSSNLISLICVVLLTECIYLVYSLLLSFFFFQNSVQATAPRTTTDYEPLSTDLSAQTKHPKISLPTRVSFITLMISQKSQSPQTSVVTTQSTFSKTKISPNTIPTIKPSKPADATTKKGKLDSSGNCFYIVQM